MPDTEELKIPKPPDTMRATPQAIAHELEPYLARLTETVGSRVLAEMNALFGDVTARSERDRLEIAADIGKLREELTQQHRMILHYLTTLEQRIVEVSEKQTTQGATLRAHAGRIRASEIKLRRLEAKLSKKRGKRAAKS